MFANENDYLYRVLDNDGGWPIVDYYRPDEADGRPDFLYQENFPYHRIVEFYSPGCPHCRHFAPKYIEFGRQFQEFSQKQQGDNKSKNWEVKFYAVSCMAHRKLCQQEKLRGYPTIKVYKANANEGTVYPLGDLKPEILVKKLGIREAKDIGTAQPSTEPPQTQPLEVEEKPAFLSRLSVEIFGDAYLSFHTAMKTAVFMDDSNKLSPEKELALSHWLTLMQKVLPWRNQFHPLLDALLGGTTQGNHNFKASIQSEQTWLGILERHPPDNAEYSPACQLHDYPYTCGLWTLFHIVTVGVVEFHQAILVQMEEEVLRILNMEQVSQWLRDFIRHFLLCQVCTDHFLQEYDACSYDRCRRFSSADRRPSSLRDWQQLPLWLLDTHNGVNVRLQSERAAGATVTAVQQQRVLWPPVEHCPGCWLEGSGTASVQRYNETAMYSHLRSTYFWDEDSSAESLGGRQDILRLQGSPSTSTDSTKPVRHDPNLDLTDNAAFVDATSMVGSHPNLDAFAGATETGSAALSRSAGAKEFKIDSTARVTTDGGNMIARIGSNTEGAVNTSNGGPFSASFDVVSRQVQYALVMMVLVVVVVWNKRRFRPKSSTRTL